MSEQKEVDLKAHCKEIAKRYGSYRNAAKVLEMDFAYLYCLAAGRKTNPSKKMLKKLGLRAEPSVKYFTVGRKNH